MKRIITILFVLILTTGAFAQAPSKMSYQAVVRGSTGQLKTTAPIGMKISILQGSPTGNSVYTETQSTVTNDNGLATLTIGNGNVVSGSMNSIDWSNGPYFIKTETDPNGGTNYTISGTSQMMSVPFAMYAERSGTPGPQGPAGNDGLTTSVNGVQQVSGNITIDKSDIGLADVDNTNDASKPISTATQGALNQKANIASPSFTGTPTTTTATPGNNSTQIASTAFVQNAVNSAVVSGTTPDADATIKGKVALGGDIGGIGSTAEAPLITEFAVTNTKIAADAVTSVKIADANITTAKVADANITTSKIANANVTTAKIADDNVTTAKIANQGVTSAKIADDNVTGVKIAADAVTTVKIADNNVTTAKIANSSITSSKIADDNITTAKIADGSITSVKIADDNVTTAKIAAANVTTAKIADANVTSAKIADANVTSAKIADANVTTAKIADANVTTVKIADGNVTAAKIADANIITAKIADENVTTSKIADANITNIKLATNSVTTSKIVDANITTAKYANASITTAKIADASVTGPKIADNSVDNNHIVDAAVTYAKMQDVSASNKILGRTSPGQGQVEEISTTGSGDVVRESSPSFSGSPTAPTASPSDNSTQIATTAFTHTAISASEIKDTPSGMGLSLSDADAGKIVTTQWAGWPDIPDNLSNGFTCTIINYSNSTFTSTPLANAFYFTPDIGWNNGGGSATFSIKSGGTVKLSVVEVNGIKSYFVTGDIF